MYKLLLKLIDKLTLPLLSICSILSGIYIYFNNVTYGDEYLAILPVTYGLFLLLLYFTTPLSRKNIFIFSFLLVSFARYVLHPSLSTYLGGYNGRSHLAPLDETYIEAIFLMSYELIIVGGAIICFESIYKNKLRQNHLFDSRAAFGIKTSVILFLMSILLLVSFPQAIFTISFVIPNTFGEDVSDINSGAMFASMFFIFSKNILAINLIYHLSHKYSTTQRKKYLYAAVFFSLITMLIYSGTNRTDFLINVIVVFLLLYYLFGKVILKYAVMFIGVLVFILVLITQHREYVNNTANNLELKNDYMQTYFGGVYNVAIGLEIEKNYPEASSASVFFFDIFRPMIGINLLIKNMDIKYSNIYFNDRMWRHVDRRSQILPMVAQSNLFFGKIGAPILSLLFIILAYALIFLSKKDIALELNFFITLVLFRLGFVFGQNTMNLINDLSMNLFLPIFLLFIYKTLLKGVGK